MRRGFVTPASGNNPLPKVLDQAVGFLAVHGTRVIRMRRRCPMMWFANVQVAFEWYRGRNYFVRHFLGTDPTDPPWIPPQIGPVIPFGNMATAGRLRWSQIEGICREWPDRKVGTRFGATGLGEAQRVQIQPGDEGVEEADGIFGGNRRATTTSSPGVLCV